MSRPLFVLSVLLAPLFLHAQSTHEALRLERVTAGLSNPVFVTHAPGDETRLFVVEQGTGTTARVRIVERESGVIAATPFLTLSGVTTGGERGLLGLAFHPAYATNGYLYLNYTATDAAVNPVSPHLVTRVERHTVAPDDPDRADPASARLVLAFPQPYGNHNGGWLGFGPDGFLYLATGDGGSGNDPLDAAQRLLDNPLTANADEALLGKLLRLDVDRDDFPADPVRHYGIPPDNPFVGSEAGRDEIWAHGLRNPWRSSFDRLTGDLWIADVGQSDWEEINFQPAASLGGENYGWRPREGLHDNPGVPDPAPVPRVDPVFEYDHNEGFSITGGYVYRGSAMPWLQGTYFYADFVTAFVRSFRWNGSSVEDARDWTAMLAASLPAGQSLNSIASFGEDALGELYVVDRGGELFRFTQSAFDLWRNEHFTTAELEAGGITGPDHDPDGDGAGNAIEFVSGGDPRHADGPWGPLVSTVEVDGARYLELTWTLDPAQAGAFSLAPEATDDFATGIWTDEALNILEHTPSLYRVRDTLPLGAESPRWLRVSVSLE
jgi:glucose/arabinose dehydrogenase